VNNEPIQFALEGEDNLGQVVNQLQEWLLDNRLTISGLVVDGNDLPLYAPERWNTHPLGNVSNVSVTASTYREMKLSTFQTILQYVVLLHNGIEERRYADLKELLAEYRYIRKSLIDLIGPVRPELGELRLDDLLDRSGLLEGRQVDDEEREGLLVHLKNLQFLVIDRMKEITQPEQEAAFAAVLLQQTIPEISEVSLLLQTGKDREAMAAVVRFTELLGKVIRIVPYVYESNPAIRERVTDGKSLADVTGDLNRFLNELVDAFTAQDSVLIGDLLEYEVAPRVQQVVTLLADDPLSPAQEPPS